MFKQRCDSVSQDHKLSLKKKLSLIVLALLIFVAGIQTGNGSLRLGHLGGPVAKKLPNNLDYAGVEEIYDQLRGQYDGQLDVNKLQDGMKQGLVAAAGDPYTVYLNAKDAKDFNEQLSGSFEGIGAELGKDKDAVIVVAPIDGTPAAKAGLRPKDIIAKIDDKDAIGLTVEAARNKIRGPSGSQVKLTIIRGQQELNLTITRDTITIPSVESKILDGNIGYLRVSRFAEDTSGLASQTANKFKQAGVKGVILDLRGDPGGYLESAVDVSSLWLKNKTVLLEKRGGVTVKTYQSRGDAVLQGVPTVVLIDEGSASASEITAGALHDNGAASLLGAKSFGKGSVQQPEEQSDGSLLKVTIARWFTPAGKNIDKSGITPDQAVARTDDDYKNNRDPQLDAAVTKLKAL